MTLTAQTIHDLTLIITQEIHVRAPLDATFAALLEQMGPHNEKADGTPMPMKIELWPGGRWYRDLGGENGHFWGHVQAIKRPTLLEINGPLFASYPFVSNVRTGSAKWTVEPPLPSAILPWASLRKTIARELTSAGHRCSAAPANTPRRHGRNCEIRTLVARRHWGRRA